MKISIVTASYNSAATIADTLRSIAMQTHADIEHIVIDGGSSDNTLQIVRAHGRPDLKVVSECDRGIYDAMNKGIRMATGDVVGLINSDDFYASSQVLAIVAAVFADPQIQACWGDLYYVKQDDTSQIVRYWRSSPFQPGLFARGWCPPHPTLFVRREVYERLGRFDLRYPIAADMELMARFLEVHRIRALYIDQVLVHMRMGGTTNRSLRNIMQQNREIWSALQLHKLAPSLWPFISGKLVARARQFLMRPSA